ALAHDDCTRWKILVSEVCGEGVGLRGGERGEGAGDLQEACREQPLGGRVEGRARRGLARQQRLKGGRVEAEQVQLGEGGDRRLADGPRFEQGKLAEQLARPERG